jgi:hypothetical protein
MMAGTNENRWIATKMRTLAGKVLMFFTTFPTWAPKVSSARFPILIGITVSLFPYFGPKQAPQMLGNLFETSPVGTGIVMFATMLCAISTAYTLMFLWNPPDAAELKFSFKPGSGAKKQVISEVWLYVITGLVALPTLVQLAVRREGASWPTTWGIVIGTGTAVILRFIAIRLISSWTNPDWRAAAFGAFAAVVYAIGWIAGPIPWIPAITYLLSLTLVGIWAAFFLTRLLDRVRVPILGAFVIAFIALSSFVPAPHKYRVEPWNGDGAPDARAVLNKFATDNDSTLVIVAASGGGITASLWTTRMLRELGLRFGDTTHRFNKRVALISSVSGGSVGAMYYVNAFGPTGISPQGLDSAVEASGSSSLSATVRSAVYWDLLRLIIRSDRDRAWALEDRWRELLGPRGTRLSDWAPDVRNALRPLQIFNATIEETGERFLMAPAYLSDSATALRQARREFIRLYPQYDAEVVTAARLSATFPYVTPTAQAGVKGPLEAFAYHMADGGYYDNSGIVSAIETIDTWLKWSGFCNCVRRIALIEIRAGGLADTTTKPAAGTLKHSATAPINTMMTVRETAEVARNSEAIGLVKRVWKMDRPKLTFEHFVFTLSGDSPLSWHLSRKDKARIACHLPSEPGAECDIKPRSALETARMRDSAEIERLGAFLRQ